MQRRLAALEPEGNGAARPRALPLVATGGRLTATRPRASPNSTLLHRTTAHRGQTQHGTALCKHTLAARDASGRTAFRLPGLLRMVFSARMRGGKSLTPVPTATVVHSARTGPTAPAPARRHGACGGAVANASGTTHAAHDHDARAHGAAATTARRDAMPIATPAMSAAIWWHGVRGYTPHKRPLRLAHHERCGRKICLR